ncbi:unnamed protein product, partial [Phaeothamnion confervicola]
CAASLFFSLPGRARRMNFGCPSSYSHPTFLLPEIAENPDERGSEDDELLHNLDFGDIEIESDEDCPPNEETPPQSPMRNVQAVTVEAAVASASAAAAAAAQAISPGQGAREEQAASSNRMHGGPGDSDCGCGGTGCGSSSSSGNGGGSSSNASGSHPDKKAGPEASPAGSPQSTASAAAAGGGSGQVCMICLENLQTSGATGGGGGGDGGGGAKLLGVLDACSHVYCMECIIEWAKVTNTCPQCKTRFRTVHGVRDFRRSANGAAI